MQRHKGLQILMNDYAIVGIFLNPRGALARILE